MEPLPCYQLRIELRKRRLNQRLVEDLVDEALQGDGLVAFLDLFDNHFRDFLEILRGDLVQQRLERLSGLLLLGVAR